MNIFVFGDSRAFGAGDDHGGWPARLRSYIDPQGFECNVYNLSIDGNTSADLVRRFDSELKERVAIGETNVIFVDIGMSDAAVRKGDNDNPQVAQADFQKNIETLVKTARAYTPHIAFCGITPVDDLIANPAAWEPTLGYTQTMVAQYNTALRSTTTFLGVAYIDLSAVFEKRGNNKALLADGMHYTSEGHAIIAEEIMRYFEQQHLLHA